MITWYMFQSALGLQDLGQFYHTPVRDGNGSILLVTSCALPDPKQISTTHVKWMPFSKLQRKMVANTNGNGGASAELTAVETVISSTPVSVHINNTYIIKMWVTLKL